MGDECAHRTGLAERQNTPRSIPELDGVRGLAILMVFAFHYISPAKLGSIGQSVIGSLWSGVDLFFVLSGFLITGILLRTKSDQRYFLNFFARRTLRIFPLYFGVAITVFLLLPNVLPFDSPSDRVVLENQSWVWTYTVNIKSAIDGFYPFLGDTVYLHHLWSLAVEEQFYLIWPVVVYICSPRSLRLVCVACIAGALVLRLGFVYGNTTLAAPYLLTPCQLDLLAMGALLGASDHDASGRGIPLSRRWVVLGVIAVPMLIVLEAVCGGLRAEGNMTGKAFAHSLFAMAFAGLIAAQRVLPVSHYFRRMFRLRPLCVIGKYSYGLYMYHMLLFPAFREVFTTSDLEKWLGMGYSMAGLLRVVSVFAACMAISVVSWNVVESYPLKLKRYFSSTGGAN